MTVLTTDIVDTYAGNGATTVFAFTFPVLVAGDLDVDLVDATTGVVTQQTITTHYTLTGVGNSAGGSATFVTAPPTGKTVRLKRVMTATQPTSFKNQGAFLPETHEAAFDRATMVLQQVASQSGRAVRLADEDVSGANTILPTPAANKLLMWDSGGTALVNRSVDDVFTVAVASQNWQRDTFSGNGVSTAFVLAADPGVENNTQVYISGVYQQKSEYSISGTTLTFNIAPPTGTNNIEVVYGVVGTGPVSAADVVVAPTGTITSVNVQAALVELDADIAAITGTTLLPTTVATVASLNTNASCAVYDNCLFVCEYDNDSLACYAIGPDNYTLALTQRLALAVGAKPRGISIRDGVAYVVNTGTDTIQVIDVTNKTGLTSISTAATAVDPKDLCINGNDIYIFCNSGFVQKWTIDGKYTVTKRYSVASAATCLGGAVINDVLVVVGQNGVLQTFTLSTLTSLYSGALGAWLSYIEGRGTLGYAVDYTNGMLYKFDLKNPSSPSLVASVATSPNPSTIKINGDYAYIPCLSNPGKLDVFNLTTFTKIHTATTTLGQPGYLAFNGAYLFLSGHNAPLSIDSLRTGIEFVPDEYQQRMIDRSAGNYARANTPFKNVITKTTNYTVVLGDEYIRVGLGATITLPAASIVYAGMLVTVANVHASLSSPIAGGVVAWTIPARSAMSFICSDDGTQWDVATWAPSFRGALVYKSASQSVPSGADTILTFDSEVYDTDIIHDNVTNNDRLTVPAGVTKIRVYAYVDFQANASGTYRSLFFNKNGSTFIGFSPVRVPNIAGAGADQSTRLVSTTPPITVVAGDYLQVGVKHDVGANINVIGSATSTCFGMEIVQ